MIDNFERGRFDHFNEWVRLANTRTIYRLLEHGVISVRESEFLENIAAYRWLSEKQATWVRAIDERAMISDLQQAIAPPPPDEFYKLMVAAARALNEPNPAHRPSLGTNLGKWKARPPAAEPELDERWRSLLAERR